MKSDEPKEPSEKLKINRPSGTAMTMREMRTMKKMTTKKNLTRQSIMGPEPAIST
jgi:hypothetical protein